ncbi:MAG: polysaccharide deacetylase family protein [Firmicutes bacterium]|nr:polysaccharide deacetylase family protein [Bacillota bacterium]
MLITFDDGYPGIATQALPVLEQYHLCATLFLIGNTVGRPGYLSAAQLQRLVDSGLFDIEGHTFAGHDAAPGHPAFSEMTPPEFQRDQELEVALFRRFHIPAPVAIAYPHGRPNLRLVPLLARDGYRVGFTVVPGWISPHDNPWLLPRWIVWPRMPLHRFAAILTHHGRA